MRGNKQVLVLLVVLLFLSSLAYALTVSVGPAKMYLTAESGKPYESNLKINNPNNQSVSIEIVKSTELINIVKFDEEKFVMQPDEKKELGFTVLSNKPGIYSGKFVVVYRNVGETKGGAAPSITVVITVKGDDLGGEVPEINDSITNDTVPDEKPDDDIIVPDGNPDDDFNIKDWFDFDLGNLFDKDKALVYIMDLLIFVDVILILILAIRRIRK